MTSKFETLHGHITGAGERTIVLSHGFGSDQSAWDAIRPTLNRDFRVISYDLAGAGPDGEGSYVAKRHASLYGYADDLIGILEELHVEDCIYIGHSVSGMIGAAAAAARPDVFGHLIMIGASPRYYPRRLGRALCWNGCQLPSMGSRFCASCGRCAKPGRGGRILPHVIPNATRHCPRHVANHFSIRYARGCNQA